MGDLESVTFDGQVYCALPDDNRMHNLRRDMLWEPEVSQYLMETLTQETTFLDVGAQFGYYTILAAKRAGRVIAFEPRASCLEVLRENVKRNGHANVEVRACALFSERTEGSVDAADIFRKGQGAVQAMTLDEAMEGQAVHVVKIDVEGSEHDILLGAAQTIRAQSPVLIVELHALKLRQLGRTADDVFGFLDAQGYGFEVMDYGGDLDYLVQADMPGHLLCKRIRNVQ